jgi:hypothetical protein
MVISFNINYPKRALMIISFIVFIILYVNLMSIHYSASMLKSSVPSDTTGCVYKDGTWMNPQGKQWINNQWQ